MTKEESEVRGLLCGKCNRGIGHFNDNPELIMKIIEYLKGEINFVNK